MNQKLQELYEESIAAIYEGKEMSEDFFERIDALSTKEKNEVSKAIHDYSLTIPEEVRNAIFARNVSQENDPTNEGEYNEKEFIALLARIPESGQQLLLAYAKLLLAQETEEELYIDTSAANLLKDVDF